MTPALTHGCIMGGVVGVPDMAAALADYHGRLGLGVVADRPVTGDLAESWGCPAIAGARMVTLQPASGAHCMIRLIEQPLQPDFKPTTTFGWGAYEITVQDVFGWPERLSDGGFEIIGPPREIEGLPYFVAMQMTGTGREMIYLNETRMNTPSLDLPVAASPTDHLFIVILASPDREATLAWYRDKLDLDVGDTYTIEYTMINDAFGLPPGTTSSLSMLRKGRLPIIEVDDYPASATKRDAVPGRLPPGNAIVSLGVRDLDALDLAFVAPSLVRDDAPYGGRRAATVIGTAGELLELIEI